MRTNIKAVLSTTILPLDGNYSVKTIKDIDITGVPHYIGHPATKEIVEKFSLYTDGIINYRIGSRSKVAASLGLPEAPGFELVSREGDMIRAKRPSDPLLEEDLFKLIGDE